MKCMCAQTRPWFILSSERVFGGKEFEPMLTPREKSPLPENFPQRRIEPAMLWTASPNTTNELFRPPITIIINMLFCICVEQDISLLPQLEPLDTLAVPPSAPPAYEATSEARRPPVGVTRQVSVTARGINSECVVCMDRMVRVVWMLGRFFCFVFVCVCGVGVGGGGMDGEWVGGCGWWVCACVGVCVLVGGCVCVCGWCVGGWVCRPEFVCVYCFVCLCLYENVIICTYRYVLWHTRVYVCRL